MTRTGLGICRNTYKKINKLELSPSCFIEVPKITYSYFSFNHNYNKILKSDWLSTTLISALIGQLNRTVRVMPK